MKRTPITFNLKLGFIEFYTNPCVHRLHTKAGTRTTVVMNKTIAFVWRNGIYCGSGSTWREAFKALLEFWR